MYCILIAGMPATGKSKFAGWLSVELGLPYMSKDAVKEILFDRVGFQSRAQKVALGEAAMDVLYYYAQGQMMAGLPFILENNFEDCSKAGISSLVEKYGYKPVTVLFDGEIGAVYRRFVARDRSPERHRGHVVNTAYPETGERPAYVPMEPDTFRMGIEQRGFRRFFIGGVVVRVDCTDFERVNYEQIAERIREAIEGQDF